MGKVSEAFRQRIVLCKTGYDFFKHANSTKSTDVDFFTTPGADVIKSINTPKYSSFYNTKGALNPLKPIPGVKLKKSLFNTITPDSFPRTGADSPKDMIREEDGILSPPKGKQS